MAQAMTAHTHDDTHAGHDHPALELTSQIEDLGPCEKKVTVTVAAATVAHHLGDATKDLGSALAMPGFRPGKAPKRLIERRFQDRIQAEVRAHLHEDGLKQVLDEHAWELLSPAEWDNPPALPALRPDAPLTFAVTIEVRPTIVLPTYAGIEVPRPPVTVEADEIDLEVRRIREERAPWVPATEGGAGPGDLLVFDAKFSVGGTVVHASEGASAVLPTERQGFPKGYEWVAKLTGSKAGDTRQATGPLPPDLPNAEHRGQPGEIAITVRAVKRRELPPLDAAALKELGVATEDALRERVRGALQAARDRDADTALEERIVELVLERTPIDLPKRLIERETTVYLQRYEVALRSRAIAADKLPGLLDEARNERRGALERGLKKWFLLEEIAKREKVFVTEDEVAARVAELAANDGKTVPEVEAELETRGLWRELRTQIKEEKVRRLLRERAKVTG